MRIVSNQTQVATALTRGSMSPKSAGKFFISLGLERMLWALMQVEVAPIPNPAGGQPATAEHAEAVLWLQVWATLTWRAGSMLI